MKQLIILFLVFAVNDLVAQNGHYTDWWHFGREAGVHFASNGPEAFYNSGMRSLEGCATISDSSGNLLFFTNGYYVWNKVNDVMPHGDSLHAFMYFNEFSSQTSDSFGNSSTNGVIIIPRPSHPSQYYIYSHVAACFNPNCTDAIVYQLVDMNSENNLGDVVERNVFLDSAQRKIAEKLSACRHANGRDWWLIYHEYESDKFVKWLLTPNGLEGPYTQSIGTSHQTGLAVIGEICFNKIGDKLGLVNIYGLVEVFHFDRCTGVLSAPITLNQQDTFPYPNTAFYGCEFAPEQPLFYSGDGDSLYQWNLTEIKYCQNSCCS
jgi:hypothetical protein